MASVENNALYTLHLDKIKKTVIFQIELSKVLAEQSQKKQQVMEKIFSLLIGVALLAPYVSFGQNTTEGKPEPIEQRFDSQEYYYIPPGRMVIGNDIIIEYDCVVDSVCATLPQFPSGGLFPIISEWDGVSETGIPILEIGNDGWFEFELTPGEHCMPVDSLPLLAGQHIIVSQAVGAGTFIHTQPLLEGQTCFLLERENGAWDPAGGIPFGGTSLRVSTGYENPQVNFQFYLKTRRIGPMGNYIENACNYVPGVEIETEEPDWTCYTIPWDEYWSLARMADHNTDGIVYGEDLIFFVANYDTECTLSSGRCQCDYDGNGSVNSGDLGALLGVFGQTVQ